MDQVTEQSVSSTRTAMTVGAVTAGIMLVFFSINLQIVGWLIFAGGIYYGMKRFRREKGVSIDYFKALFTGVQTAFFASVILAFVSYVTATMEPSLIDTTLNVMEQQLKLSNVPSDIADMAMQQWRQTLSPFVLAIATVFMCSAIGCVVAFVGAFFIQNDQLRIIK